MPSAAGASIARWQTELAQAFRDPADLIAHLDLPKRLIPAARSAAADFPMLVPRGYAARMRPGDPDDPLLRQVLPLGAETASQPPGFSVDPVGESACDAAPGLLRKYDGRALLITTAACAVHCRYCFRRHYPYDAVSRRGHWWRPAVELIAADASITEVLLSGGDPLSLPDPVLERLVADLRSVGHLKRLRIHTRLPLVLPQRVDDALLGWLRDWGPGVVVVLHANHARDVDDRSVRAACRRLRDAGAVLLNQAVLLAGVNDDVQAQIDLGEALVAAGVVPYYLHLLDPVAGAAHFDVDAGDARELQRALQDRAAGYLVPRVVREVPGAPGKVPLERLG